MEQARGLLSLYLHKEIKKQKNTGMWRVCGTLYSTGLGPLVPPAAQQR